MWVGDYRNSTTTEKPPHRVNSIQNLRLAYDMSYFSGGSEAAHSLARCLITVNSPKSVGRLHLMRPVPKRRIVAWFLLSCRWRRSRYLSRRTRELEKFKFDELGPSSHSTRRAGLRKGELLNCFLQAFRPRDFLPQIPTLGERLEIRDLRRCVHGGCSFRICDSGCTRAGPATDGRSIERATRIPCGPGSSDIHAR